MIYKYMYTVIIRFRTHFRQLSRYIGAATGYENVYMYQIQVYTKRQKRTVYISVLGDFSDCHIYSYRRYNNSNILYFLPGTPATCSVSFE